MATTTIKDQMELYRSGAVLTTGGQVTIPLINGRNYFLITTHCGYGISNANANIYLLGITATYSAKVKLTANTEAFSVDVSDNTNLVLTANSNQERYWLYLLAA